VLEFWAGGHLGVYDTDAGLRSSALKSIRARNADAPSPLIPLPQAGEGNSPLRRFRGHDHLDGGLGIGVQVDDDIVFTGGAQRAFAQDHL